MTNKNKLYSSDTDQEGVRALPIDRSQMIHMSDASLWKQYRSGDEAAFIFIYKSHFDALYRYGRQFTPSNELVEDAIQDIFVEIREKRNKLDITSSIKFYLFKALKRKIVKLIERDTKHRKTQHDAGYTEFEVSFSCEH